MNTTHAEPRPGFFGWENSGAGDFPYYRGPNALSLGRWLIVVAGVAAGLAMDYLGTPLIAHLPDSPAIRLPMAILVLAAVPGLPLLGLWLAAGSRIRELFHKMSGRDWLLAIILTVLGGAYSALTSVILKASGQTVVTDAAIGTGAHSTANNVGLLFELPVLILGETTFTVLPFLALLALFATGLKMSRKNSIIIAALVTCLLFGLMHFKAYDWNLAQMFLVIGLGQIITLFGYLKTKNFWVAYLSHLMFDFVIVSSTVLAGLGGK